MRILLTVVFVFLLGCRDFIGGTSVDIVLGTGQKYSCSDSCIEIEEGMTWREDIIVVLCRDKGIASTVTFSKTSITEMNMKFPVDSGLAPNSFCQGSKR